MQAISVKVRPCEIHIEISEQVHRFVPRNRDIGELSPFASRIRPSGPEASHSVAPNDGGWLPAFDIYLGEVSGVLPADPS